MAANAMDPFADSDDTRPSVGQPQTISLPAAVVVPGHDFAPGAIVADRFKVISLLGRGGFGCVYKVYQLLLKKEFALKTLNPANMTDLAISRFSKEAQAAGRLDHPNLVRAVDFGLIDGVQPYLVMDYVEGPTLAQYLKQHGRIDLKAALQMFIPISMALAYAHKEGVVHRDLKPSNIILSSVGPDSTAFIPRIVDFGIAKIQFGDESQALTLTGAGDVFGTPLYMSPEQCAGTGVDHRSDIYALGCLLFESLTGAPPFRGTNPLETMMQHSAAPVPSLKEASLGLEFPPALDKVIARMLAKDSRERYQNCMYVAQDLIALEQGNYDQVRAITTTGLNTIVPRKAKQPRRAILMLGLGVVAGAAIGFFAAKAEKPAQPQVVAQPPCPTTDILSPGFLKMDPSGDEGEFFLHKRGDKLVFQPPSATNHQLGTFYWWASGHLSRAIAAPGATLPANAKLIFAADSEMLISPHLWGYFRSNDLAGVLLKPHTCWLGTLVNSTVRTMPERDNLQILCLTDKSVSPRGFESIGNIADLRWLDLDGVTINDDQLLTGSQVAKLPNLKNLRVLRMNPVNSATPALAELVKASKLRRLELRSRDDITQTEVKLIQQLSSLDTLSLRGALSVPHSQLLDGLSNMPKLERLELDYQKSDIEQDGFRRMGHLKILALQHVPGNKVGAVGAAIGQRLPAGCKLLLNTSKEDNDANGWFDPLSQEPGKDELE